MQRQRARRAAQANPFKVKNAARIHALSGLIRCADCGEPMHLGGGRVYWWGRRQVRGCRAASSMEHVLEEEVGAYLRALHLPGDTELLILDAYRRARPEATQRDRQRQALETQLRRLGDLYVLGDLPKPDYEARRTQLRAELNRLAEPDGHVRPEVLGRLRRYLLDAGAA